MIPTTDGALADQPALTVTRVIDAPRELVFKAWTQSEHAVRWWGPRGFTILSCEIDARPGGQHRGSVRSPTGIVNTRRGIYREVTAPERLVFTFAWEDKTGLAQHETLVTVSFEDVAGRTRLTLHQAVFQTADIRDEHFAGWTGCLERFADFMATCAVA